VFDNIKLSNYNGGVFRFDRHHVLTETVNFNELFHSLGEPTMPIPVVLRIRVKEHCILTRSKRISKQREFVKREHHFRVKFPLPNNVDEDANLVIYSDGSVEKVHAGNR